MLTSGIKHNNKLPSCTKVGFSPLYMGSLKDKPTILDHYFNN